MKTEVAMQFEQNTIQFEKTKKQQRKMNLVKGLLFLSPSIILFSIFIFYPMIRTVYLSFFLTNQAGATTVFVGMQNYIDIFTSPTIFKKFKIDLFICSLYSASNDYH